MSFTSAPHLRGESALVTATPSRSIYNRLRRVGFTRTYIRKVAALPSWWDDSLWDNPGGLAEGCMHLSRHLGIDIQSLLDPDAPPRLKDFGPCNYKRQEGTTEGELFLARAIVTRAAQLSIAGMDRPYTLVPSPLELRNRILETAPCVGFEQLLDYCWASGVPVLHVSNFPIDARKRPVGFSFRSSERPAIVLCADRVQPAWQLFVFAHQVGHLHHGHIPENGALLDETVHKNCPEAEESQAEQYANELLAGVTQPSFQTNGRWPQARRLAELAREFGSRNHIDAGFAILNLALTSDGGFWGIANAALKQLHPTADAIRTLGERLAKNLDWERLPEDSSEFLMAITRQERPE